MSMMLPFIPPPKEYMYYRPDTTADDEGSSNSNSSSSGRTLTKGEISMHKHLGSQLSLSSRRTVQDGSTTSDTLFSRSPRTPRTPATPTTPKSATRLGFFLHGGGREGGGGGGGGTASTAATLTAQDKSARSRKASLFGSLFRSGERATTAASATATAGTTATSLTEEEHGASNRDAQRESGKYSADYDRPGGQVRRQGPPAKPRASWNGRRPHPLSLLSGKREEQPASLRTTPTAARPEDRALPPLPAHAQAQARTQPPSPAQPRGRARPSSAPGRPFSYPSPSSPCPLVPSSQLVPRPPPPPPPPPPASASPHSTRYTHGRASSLPPHLLSLLTALSPPSGAARPSPTSKATPGRAAAKQQDGGEQWDWDRYAPAIGWTVSRSTSPELVEPSRRSSWLETGLDDGHFPSGWEYDDDRAEPCSEAAVPERHSQVDVEAILEKLQAMVDELGREAEGGLAPGIDAIISSIAKSHVHVHDPRPTASYPPVAPEPSASASAFAGGPPPLPSPAVSPSTASTFSSTLRWSASTIATSRSSTSRRSLGASAGVAVAAPTSTPSSAAAAPPTAELDALRRTVEVCRHRLEVQLQRSDEVDALILKLEGRIGANRDRLRCEAERGLAREAGCE